MQLRILYVLLGSLSFSPQTPSQFDQCADILFRNALFGLLFNYSVDEEVSLIARPLTKRHMVWSSL